MAAPSEMEMWSPWHGCHRISPGCANCYVYARDAAYGKDSSVVEKTKSFDLPLRRDRQGNYKLRCNSPVFTCGTSDFFLPEADPWRLEAWSMIKARPDLTFAIITKRPQRFYVNLPLDWGQGYPNVRLYCTVENQAEADRRLPVFLSLPLRYRAINCEPLLENLNLTAYLNPQLLKKVSVGGESGPHGRDLSYQWVVAIRQQCLAYGIPFAFKQTGTHFIKNGRRYTIPRQLQHQQAIRAGLDYPKP